MSTKKRRISAAVICFTLPGTAAAAVSIPLSGVRVESSASVIASGDCGAELRWWLDSEGTLTISGNDAMTKSPWRDYYSSQIKRVIIDKDVMSICDNAFSGLTGLRSVSFARAARSQASARVHSAAVRP